MLVSQLTMPEPAAHTGLAKFIASHTPSLHIMCGVPLASPQISYEKPAQPESRELCIERCADDVMDDAMFFKTESKMSIQVSWFRSG